MLIKLLFLFLFQVFSPKTEPVTSMDVFFCLATSYSHRGKPPTTIDAEELNDRVRHGNEFDLFAIVTRLFDFQDILIP